LVFDDPRSKKKDTIEGFERLVPLKNGMKIKARPLSEGEREEFDRRILEKDTEHKDFTDSSQISEEDYKN